MAGVLNRYRKKNNKKIKQKNMEGKDSDRQMN